MAILFNRLKYTVLMPGLQIPEEIYVFLDSDYFLYHKEHPPSPLFFARKDYGNIAKGDLDYYADCLAFLHDQPTLIICETERKLQTRPLITKGFKTPELNGNNYAAIYRIYSELLDKRVNGSVLFFSEAALDRIVDADISFLRKVAREIRLYNAALKQNESYIEFFMYCRVIEAICNGLNQKWLRRSIRQIRSFDFLPVSVFANRDDIRDDKKINYNKLLLHRFSLRLKQVERQDVDIGDYYFEEMRNSIAHGSGRPFEFMKVQNITEDCIVMKLLCRYGIQKKYQSIVK